MLCIIRLLFSVERRFGLVQTISLGSKEEGLYWLPEFDVDDCKDKKLRDFQVLLASDTYLQENAPSVQPYKYFEQFDTSIAPMTTKSEITEAWENAATAVKHTKAVIASFRFFAIYCIFVSSFFPPPA